MLAGGNTGATNAVRQFPQDRRAAINNQIHFCITNHQGISLGKANRWYSAATEKPARDYLLTLRKATPRAGILAF